MSDIDELKARAAALGFEVKEGAGIWRYCWSDGSMYRCRSFDYIDESALSACEHAARLAVERTKASARVCDGCGGYGYLRMFGLQNSAGNCEKCKGKGVRFEESKS